MAGRPEDPQDKYGIDPVPPGDSAISRRDLLKGATIAAGEASVVIATAYYFLGKRSSAPQAPATPTATTRPTPTEHTVSYPPLSEAFQDPNVIGTTQVLSSAQYGPLDVNANSINNITGNGVTVQLVYKDHPNGENKTTKLGVDPLLLQQATRPDDAFVIYIFEGSKQEDVFTSAPDRSHVKVQSLQGTVIEVTGLVVTEGNDLQNVSFDQPITTLLVNQVER